MTTRHYRAAGGVVVDDATGHVLLLHRPGRLAPDSRAEMRLPKGHVEPGERDLDAALREVSEEAGLPQLDLIADLGVQRVEFEWQGTHYRRDERYFLFSLPPHATLHASEAQFERLWVSWQEAMDQITFEAEREWLRRAHTAWQTRR